MNSEVFVSSWDLTKTVQSLNFLKRTFSDTILFKKDQLLILFQVHSKN